MMIELKPAWSYSEGVHSFSTGSLRIASYSKVGRDRIRYSAVQHWSRTSDILSCWDTEIEAKEECQRQLELFIKELSGGNP